MPHQTHKVLNKTFLDRLDFTDTAKQLEALKAILFDSAHVHEAKIEFIKEELAAGRYEICSQHIASQMLEYTTSCAKELEELTS